MSSRHRYRKPKRKRSFALLHKIVRYTGISLMIALVFAWDVFCFSVMFR